MNKLLCLCAPGLILASASTVVAASGFESVYSRDASGSVISQLPDDLKISEIARQVTVRIFTKQSSGSGVIVGRNGSQYTVLTCNHVIDGEGNAGYKVLTFDGALHVGYQQKLEQLSGLDLVLVRFDSSSSYNVAVLGVPSSLSKGDRLYASGFPNYRFPGSSIESTRNLGIGAFRITTGQMAMSLDKSLPGGYSLGYTNDVREGMSGGPVFDSYGRVVAINGRLKYPIQGIDAFVLEGGSKPSKALFERMESLSWAIPIFKFSQVVGMH